MDARPPALDPAQLGSARILHMSQSQNSCQTVARGMTALRKQELQDTQVDPSESAHDAFMRILDDMRAAKVPDHHLSSLLAAFDEKQHIKAEMEAGDAELQRQLVCAVHESQSQVEVVASQSQAAPPVDQWPEGTRIVATCRDSSGCSPPGPPG